MNFEQMFLNTVEGLEAGGAKLQHVQFVSGEACSTHINLHKSFPLVMARSATLLARLLGHDASMFMRNLQVPNGTAHDPRPCIALWTLMHASFSGDHSTGVQAATS